MIIEYKGRQLVFIMEAAERMGVCRRTIYHWMKAGKIETIKNAGGRTLVFLDTLYKDKEEKEAT